MENGEKQPTVELPPQINGASDLLALAKQALQPPPGVGSLVQGKMEIAPPVAPAGQRIDEADRLALENIFLQMQNRQQLLQILDHQKNEVVMQMKDLQMQMEARRAELSKKYGVPIGPKSIDKNGILVAPAAKP
jgi:hypothetical protein